MDLRPLVYFVTVARLKSFTRAGEELRITQPTISKMIRNLEDELGVTLLERSTKQVRLTDAGEAVLAQAQQIVSAMQNLTNSLGDVVHLQRGSLRVGLPPMVGAHFFPGIIARFHELHPQVSLHLTEHGAKAIEQGVAAGDLDLGVTLLPLAEELESFAFAKEALRLVVPHGHRLAGRETVALGELAAEPFILFREDFALHDRIKRACQQAGFQPQIACESSQWDFIGEMVAARLGLALLPETVCRRLDPERVVTPALTDPAIPWHPAVIWRKDRYLSFSARAWLDLTRAAFPPSDL